MLDTSVPGWFALLPPLVAIAAALRFRTVIPSLFAGLWLGAWGVAGLDFTGLWQGLLNTVSVHVLEAIADEDHAAVILFSFMIGGLVGVIRVGGGMEGVVALLLRHARSRRGGQVATVLMGTVVFIDDYANSLIVGRTMRPVTDRLGISRAKLAYLVDSTAAPVAGVALITTWIGYQLGLLGDAITQTPGLEISAYGLFLESLKYSFYPWLALLMVLWVAASGRDFGPMLAAERRAALEHRDLPPAVPIAEGGATIWFAGLPLIVLVVGVVLGLLATGEGENLREIIGSASSYKALLWASLAAVAVAIFLPLAAGRKTLEVLLDGWSEGVAAMLPAMTILVLAWALAGTTRDLGTADVLVSLLDGVISPELLPTLVFLLAAATAFATGTSWGTMGILVPLAVPLAFALDGSMTGVFQASVAAVLAGAILGDHCSPISDTTILSSMATECDHIEHVRTQLPYALVVGLLSVLAGWMPVGWGLPWWGCFALGIALLAVVMRLVAQPVDAVYR